MFWYNCFFFWFVCFLDAGVGSFWLYGSNFMVIYMILIIGFMMNCWNALKYNELAKDLVAVSDMELSQQKSFYQMVWWLGWIAPGQGNLAPGYSL